MILTMGKYKSYRLLITLLFLFSHLCFALPEDQKKIIQLRADTADINQETHKGIYTQHVEFDQGTTHLRAAQATTKVNEKNKLTEVTADGDAHDQAHFWTLMDEKKPPLHAYANSIRYFPDKHLIQLIGNARVEQGKDSFSAPSISYDTLHKHVISQSNGQGRTVIIFHPEKRHE